MAKKYRINPETLQLERIEHGFRYWLRRSGGYILGGICLGILFFYVFLYFYPSPREAALSHGAAGGPDADRPLRPLPARR